MQYVNLGRTGLKVSRICLGAMSYGDPGWRPWILSEEAGRPFDLAAVSWIGVFPDASDYINSLFDSRFIGDTNIGGFRSPKYDRMMRHAATLSGEARYRAFGNLDVELARDAAPRVEIAFEGVPTFVSKRVGCVLLRPELDLAAVCLK